jgi:hypothetical protein
MGSEFVRLSATPDQPAAPNVTNVPVVHQMWTYEGLPSRWAHRADRLSTGVPGRLVGVLSAATLEHIMNIAAHQTAAQPIAIVAPQQIEPSSLSSQRQHYIDDRPPDGSIRAPR